jgi:hypothetical protein
MTGGQERSEVRGQIAEVKIIAEGRSQIAEVKLLVRAAPLESAVAGVPHRGVYFFNADFLLLQWLTSAI